MMKKGGNRKDRREGYSTFTRDKYRQGLKGCVERIQSSVASISVRVSTCVSPSLTEIFISLYHLMRKDERSLSGDLQLELALCFAILDAIPIPVLWIKRKTKSCISDDIRGRELV